MERRADIESENVDAKARKGHGSCVGVKTVEGTYTGPEMKQMLFLHVCGVES